MPSYVIDASVGIKFFITEELADEAAALLAQVSHFPATQFVVPDLFFVECANILWKHVRRFDYPKSRASEDIQILSELAFESYPTMSLVNDALAIALAYEISAYDACYVALGRQIGALLVTADKRLVNKFANTDYQVVWLGDLDVGPVADAL